MSRGRELFDIYRKPQFDNTIQKIVTREYVPFVKSFECNDLIEITINQSDSWLILHDAALIIKGSLKRTKGNGEVRLINNAGAFLFDTITYILSGQEVETVRDPGIITTIRSFLCYSNDDKNVLSISGWNYPENATIDPITNNFHLRIPLRHLFNIFNDYQMVQFGKQSFRFLRSRSNDDALSIKEPSPLVTKTEAELIINDVSLMVDVVLPEDVLKLQLLNTIKHDKSIIIPFRKWEMHNLPQLTENATHEIWTAQVGIRDPKYVCVAFQNNKRNDVLKNPTQFDHVDISDVRVIINGDYFPSERIQSNFAENDYVEIFHRYTEFKKSYKNEIYNNDYIKNSILNYTDFKNNAPLFVIDCSKRPESIKDTYVDIKIDIESRKQFPSNITAYCIVIQEMIMEHFPLTERVRTLL